MDCYGGAMLRYDRDMRALALGYAALAGSVDAVGFLKSGGLFVSFMTGNSTRLAIGVAQMTTVAASAAALIALFVLGVVLNVLVSESLTALHRKVTATLGVSILLVAAATSETLGLDRSAVACLCLAMGASNAIFRRDGEVTIGVTYMTGTLVRLGHRLADAVRGASNAPWVAYLLLWLSLLLGGVVGATCFLWSALFTFWAVALASIALAAVTYGLTSRRVEVPR